MRSAWALFAATLLVVTVGASRPATAQEEWSLEVTPGYNWYRVAEDGSLLLAMETSLTSYDGATGAVRWQRDDLAGASRRDVRSLADAGLLFVKILPPGKKKKKRRSKNDPPPRYEAIDMVTGQTTWELGALEGSLLAVSPTPYSDILLVFEQVKAKKRDDSGIFLSAHRIFTGERLWRIKYGSHRAKLGGSSSSRSRSSSANLAVFPKLAVDEGLIYLPYFGLHGIDILTGEIKIAANFTTSEGGMRYAYAAPLVTADTVYAAGDGLIAAYDKASGAERWRAKIKGSTGPAAEMQLVGGGLLLVRAGGVFSTGSKVQDADPFAVMALDRATGKERWRYRDAKGSITNLVVDEARGQVVFADGEAVIALSLELGAPQYEAPLQFFRTYGIFKEKSSGFSIGGGFSKSSSGPGGSSSSGGGGLLGFGSSGPDIGDLPIEASRLGENYVLRGQQSILEFDPNVGLTQWSIIFGDTDYTDRTLLSTSRMPAYSPKGRAYYLTILPVGKGRRAREVLTVLGIRKSDGRVVSRLDLEGKEPVFYLDPAHDRMFRFIKEKKRARVMAYEL